MTSAGHRQQNTYTRNTHRRNSQTCYRCGGEFPHRGQCPAEGRECSYCGRQNHFAKVCLRRLHTQEISRQSETTPNANDRPEATHTGEINSVDHVDDNNNNSTDDYVFAVEQVEKVKIEANTDKNTHTGVELVNNKIDGQNSNPEENVKNETTTNATNESKTVNAVGGNKTSTTTVRIGNVNMKVCVDTGCPQNLIGENSFKRIQKARPESRKIQLAKSSIVLRTYFTKQPLPIMGKFQAVIETDKKVTVSDMYVVKGDAENLLSCTTSEELNLVKISSSITDEPKINKVSKLHTGEISQSVQWYW
jgi:hypothetical protein